MKKFVKIATRIPGPKSTCLLEKKDAEIPVGAYHNFPIFVKKALNSLITDIDDNVYIDFTSGIGALNIGSCNEAVMKAAQAQLEKFSHTCFHVAMYEPYIELAGMLNDIIPGDDKKKTYLLNTGAEAIENAVKIARYHTGRSGIISFEKSFHGRTLLGMTLTGKAGVLTSGFGPMAPEIYQMPFYHCSSCSDNKCISFCSHFDESQVDDFFETHVSPEHVAAIVFEPVVGEGGILPQDSRFLRFIFKRAREHGIMTICDEIQTGLGRTGKMMAIEHYNLQPDIVVTGKSLGGGLPIAAVTGKAAVMDAVPPGGIGSTYTGNPVACAAAIEVLKYLLTNNVVERAHELGICIRHRLQRIKRTCRSVCEVRGVGAMNGLQIRADKHDSMSARERVNAIQKMCFESGLLVLKAGSQGDVIRLLMPLTIEDDVLNEGLDILHESISMME